jgi:isopenicillin N synthase-like dioxygenase
MGQRNTHISSNINARLLRRGWVTLDSPCSADGVLVPLEILAQITSYIPTRMKIKLGIVCRAWRKALEREECWGEEPPSTLKYLYWQPKITREVLIGGDLSIAPMIYNSLVKEGFIIVTLQDEPELIPQMHQVIKHFWNNAWPSIKQEKSDDTLLRQHYHLSVMNSTYPWPGISTEDKAIVTKYHSIVQAIAAKILYLISHIVPYKQNKNWYKTFVGDNEGREYSFLRFLSYSKFEPDEIPKPHTDIGILSVIPCSSTGTGLRFAPLNGKEIDIETTINATDLMVFGGELLQVLTEGTITAMRHKVLLQTVKRYNVVYQLRADPYAELHDLYYPSSKSTVTQFTGNKVAENEFYAKRTRNPLYHHNNINTEPLYRGNEGNSYTNPLHS